MTNKTKFLKLGIAVLLGAGVVGGLLYAQLSIPTNIDNSEMTIKKINLTVDGQDGVAVITLDGSSTTPVQIQGSTSIGDTASNKITGQKSSILGGVGNQIKGNNNIIGGNTNSISGTNSVIPGGIYNIVNSDYSFAAGNMAKVNINHHGTFIWSDNQGGQFQSTKANQFLIRAQNGVGINTGVTTTGYALTVQGSGIVYGNLRANNMVAGAYYYGSITNDQEAYELKLSQWEGTTGDIYYNSGYVGVGTPTPTAQFHNNGTVRLQGLSTSTQATALVVDTNGNVGRRTLNTIAFNGVTESDPTVNTLAKATLSCTNGQVAKFNGTSWACAADAGLTSETDPQVGSLTNGRWCTTNGTTVNCTTVAPVTSESDPTVNALAKATLSCSTNQIVKWNGSVRACAADGGLTSETDPTAVKLTTNQTVAGIKTFSSNGIFNANVGIGIATPSEKLDVNGNVKAIKIIASGARNTSYNINAGDIGANSLYGYDAVCTNNSYGNCQGAGGVVIGRANASSVINIPTNGNVFFNNGGNVGIGTTTPIGVLDVRSPWDSGKYLLALSTSENTKSTPNRFYVKANGDAYLVGYLGIGMTDFANGAGLNVNGPTLLSGTVNIRGSVTAQAFYYSSDLSLKKDLTEISNPLEKIIALNGYDFTWKKDNTQDIGVVAQEVEKVFPTAVKTDDKGLKSVKYGNLVAPIIEAIKELYNKYLDQQNQISTLEKRIEMLEKSINK